MTAEPLTCRRCGMPAPPPDQTCEGGVDHFVGTTLAKRTGRWEARICFNKQIRALGTFDDEEAAARAYDVAALETWGEFAVINFPQREG